MPNYYAPIQQPEIRNALLDLSPVNNALEGVRDQNNANRNALLQQSQLDMRKEEQTYQRGRDQKQDARVDQKYFADGAQSVMNLPATDPRRAAVWQNLLKRHPNPGSLTPDYLDPVKGPEMVLAEYGALADPRDSRMKDLELQKTQAQINNYNREADQNKVVEVNGRLVQVSPSGAKEIYSSPNSDSMSRAKGAPSGYLWKDPNNPSAGVEPVPGFDKPIPGDVAGKVAMMNMARQRIEKTRGVFERNWGVGDAAKYAAANVPLVGDLGFASGDVGVAARDVRTGIEAALRTMTGAAAPEPEVTRYMQMFMPNVKDTKETARQKLDGLVKFMEDAETLVLQGRGSTPNLGGAPPAPSGPTDLKSKYGLE